MSFAGFERDVASLAARLKDRSKGRWLVVGEDAYAVAVGFLAALYAKQTVILPANLELGHLSELAGQTDGILVHEKAVPPSANAIPILGSGPRQTEVPLDPLDPDEAGVILHTSGTTGGPVFIQKSLRCFEEEIVALETLVRPTSPCFVWATVPAQHIYGLLFRVLWPLAAGRPFAAELIRFPGELLRALENAENGLLVSSPAFLRRALGVLDVRALNDRLCGVFSSGGPLPQDVAVAYNSTLSRPIIEVYGSTETGGVGYRSVCDTEKPEPWTPLPGVTLSVEADSGTLSVSSPFLYCRDRFTTADRARLLADGRFELLGRSDRIVKVEERRVSLTDVERKLASRVEVTAVIVVPLEDASGRKVLGAVIVPSSEGWSELAKSGKRALTETLRETLRPYLDRAVLPRRWRFVRRMPETIQGKIPVSELKALFDDDLDNVTRPIQLDRETDSTTLLLRLRLPSELKYFDGHFDGHPILPGVVQLHWAIQFAQETFSFRPVLGRIDALKFFRVLSAGEDVTLELRFEREKEKLHFRYSSEKHEHSAGRIQFGGSE